MAGRRILLRRLGVTAAALGILLLLLALFVPAKGLERASALSGILALVAAIGTLLIQVWPTMVAWTRAAPAESAGLSLDDVARRIAQRLQIDWSMQERDRKVKDPYPLPVGWQVTAEARKAMAGVTWRDVGGVTPATVKGTFNDLADLLVTGLPARRLVVLGEAGAGKSVLALRLCLNLLPPPGSGDPVPVLLSLASWEPEDDLLDFAAGQLARDHTGLDEFIRPGVTIASALISTGRLLLVLDGLDEMKKEFRGAWLRKIRAMDVDMPLVVTSRTDEYQQAVEDAGAGIPRAAVVQLQPLTQANIKKYLTDATNPPSSRWDPVFNHLAQDKTGPLALVLQTPLMISLARTIYARAGTTPAYLVEIAGNRDLIEDHLLSEFIRAVYAPKGKSAVGHASAYLRFIAHHLQLENNDEFAWWDLNRRAPKIVHGIFGGLPMGIPLGLVVAVVAGVSTGPVLGLGIGLAVGVPVALGAGLFGMGVSWRPLEPKRRIKVSVRDDLARFPRRLGLGLLRGLGFGAVIGIPVGFVYGLRYGVLVTIALGPAVGFAVTLRQLFDSPTDLEAAVSPGSVLSDDRQSAIVQASMAGVGLVIGAVIAVVVTIRLGTATGLWVFIAYGLTYGGAVGLGLRSQRLDTPAYLSYLIARLWLAAQGKLPLNLMPFLEDAHERGVFRRQGPVYRFRHDRLQKYLSSGELANNTAATTQESPAILQDS